MEYKFPCYKCGREMHLLYDRWCCKRLQGDIGVSRGKVIKSKPKPNKVIKNENENEKRRQPRKKSRSLKPEVRETVLKRDGYKCTKCNCKKNLHVHHIIHRKDGGTDDIMNLLTLCDLCHAEEHKGEPVYNIMIKSFWDYEEIV
jgi:5-methylcytosine-specific restriction endonuclease McrA